MSATRRRVCGVRAAVVRVGRAASEDMIADSAASWSSEGFPLVMENSGEPVGVTAGNMDLIILSES